MSSIHRRTPISISGTLSFAIAFGFCGFFGFAFLEFAARTIFFPEWVGLLPVTSGANPHFGTFTLPNLHIRRFSPANFDVINSTNSFGFRDRQENFDKDLGGVWVFGDSNTFGMGINDNDTYTNSMDKAGIPTANLAGLGFNLKRDLKILRKLKEMGHQPRAALIALSMNIKPLPPIVKDHIIKDHVVLPAAQLASKLSNLMEIKILSFRSIKTILLRNVALYGFMKTYLVSIPLIRDYLRDQGLVQDVDLLPLGPAWMTKISRQNDVRVAAAVLADRLATMKKELGPIPFGVILLPNLHHLYPVRFQKYLTHKGMSLENRDASQPYETIRSTLKERQIIIVEVLDGLRETGDPQLMFYSDAHFNAKGHKVIARIVSNWVRTR